MRGAIPAKISSAYKRILLLAIKYLNHGYNITKIKRDMFPTWTQKQDTAMTDHIAMKTKPSNNQIVNDH